MGNLCQLKHYRTQQGSFHYFYLKFSIFHATHQLQTCVSLKSTVIVLHLFCVKSALVERIVPRFSVKKEYVMMCVI